MQRETARRPTLFKEYLMKTRQELVLDFMLALAGNPIVIDELEQVDQLAEAAGKLADAYLKTLG